LQISSYGAKTAVIGEECRLACNITGDKYNVGNKTYIGQPTLNFFKNFNMNGTENGFAQESFMGKYIRDEINFTLSASQGYQYRTLEQFITYVIFTPMAKSLLYQNDQSGYLGLGPYTTDGGDERTDSFMY